MSGTDIPYAVIASAAYPPSRPSGTFPDARDCGRSVHRILLGESSATSPRPPSPPQARAARRIGLCYAYGLDVSYEYRPIRIGLGVSHVYRPKRVSA
eukprot:1145382-Rhodomonas_salina.2